MDIVEYSKKSKILIQKLLCGMTSVSITLDTQQEPIPAPALQCFAYGAQTFICFLVIKNFCQEFRIIMKCRVVVNCLIPLPKVIHASLLGSFLLPTFFEAVDCILVIICFISSIHLWVNTYCVCFSKSGLPHLGWLFSSSIHLPANFMMPLFFTAE